MKSMINTTIDLWQRFWFASVSPYPLAGMRILFGFYLFCHFIIFLPVADQIYSNEGVNFPILIGDLTPSPLIADALYLLFLTLILFFMLGLFTRMVTPLVLLGYGYYYLLDIGSHNTSYDILMLLLLFILSFAELDKVWSIRHLWPGSKVKQDIRICAWAQRLISIHISVVYIGMSLCKLIDPAWYNGTMLEQQLYGEWATPLAFWLISLNLPLAFYTVLSRLVIVTEGICGVGFWFRPFQNYCFVLGLGFHLMVGLLLNIPEFLFLPTCYLLYMDPQKVQTKGNAILSQFKRLINN